MEVDGREEAVIIVGDDGEASFTGLGIGNYTLKETVVPDGCNYIDIKFKFNFGIKDTQDDDAKE